MRMEESGGLVAREPVARSPTSIFPRLAAHGNTLLLIPDATQLQPSLHVIDCSTNTRVGQLTPANKAPGFKVDSVAVSEDTVAVQLMSVERTSTSNVIKIEIWRIKTAALAEESLALERTVTVLGFAGETSSFSRICINDAFLVRVGQVELGRVGSGNKVEWFKRNRDDMNWKPSVLQVEVDGVDYRHLRVRWAQLCRGDSGMLALGVELRGLLARPDYRVVLQVRDLRRGGVVVLQHHFGFAENIERVVKASWCGPHLLVATTRLRHHAVSLLCWQPGDPGLLHTPVTVLTDEKHIILEHFHADMEQMVLAASDPGEFETKIRIFKNQL
jgi:hypothetical protein